MRFFYLLVICFCFNFSHGQLVAPSKLVVEAGNQMVNISFDVPFSQSSNSNVTYEIQINNSINFINCNESPCAIFNLINGESYVFKIRAKEGAIFSAWSDTTTAVVPSSIAPYSGYSYSNLKQVAIQMAQSRANLSLNAGFNSEAANLLLEIQQLQSQIISVPATPYYGVGFFPKANISNDSNPYYVSLHKWAMNYLNQPITNYTKATTTNVVFSDYNVARAICLDFYKIYWLLISPDSNYRYHPELFRRFLNLLYATSDDYYINGSTSLSLPGSTLNGIDDWFAQYGIVYAWRMAIFSFKDLIPESLKNKMIASANMMGSAVYNLAQSILSDGGYVNRDVSYAETLLNCGILCKNSSWYNFSNQIVSMTNANEVYPDGAFSYIWSQNEGTNYHGGNNKSLIRIYNMTENQSAKAILNSVSNFELLSVEPGFVPEFYTCPSWKMQWNASSGYSGDFLGYMNANRYYKTVINNNVSSNGYEPDLNNYVFYNKSLEAKPLANNYLVYDRNIQGLRARYDEFSYGITTRNISNPNNLGHQTLAGSMITEPLTLQKRDIHSGLLAAYAKVHIDPEITNEWSTWAYLINIISSKTALNRSVGSVSATGNLFKASSGPSATATNWQTFQEWLTLPDRMIGLIEVFPKNNSTQLAFEVDVRFRFGHGINQTGGLYNPQSMSEIIPGIEYNYGNYNIKVISHNCEQIFTAASGINRDFGVGTEVIFRNGSYNNGVMTSYPGNYRKFALVEISKLNSTSNSNLTITRYSNNGVIGIIASSPTYKYAVYRNTSTTTKTVSISDALLSGVTSKVHFPRTDFPGQNAMEINTNTIDIPANEHRLIITSNNPEEQENNWGNYDVLNENLPAISISGNDLDYVISSGQNLNFTALTSNLGNETNYQWQINGVNVGLNSSSFNYSNFQNNDEVVCIITTTLPNGSTFLVKSNIVRVTISANPAQEINYDNNLPNQISIGTLTPHNSSVLDVNDSNKGILIPRIEGNIIESLSNVAEGLVVYATTIGNSIITNTGFWYFSSGQWLFFNENSDLFHVDSVLSNNRVVSLSDKNINFNAISSTVNIDSNFESNGALFMKPFRLNSDFNSITWTTDDVGIILPTGFTGGVILPDAAMNNKRIIAIKNVSGTNQILLNDNSAMGVYSTENNNLPNKSVCWFICDGISWRKYK